MVDVVDVVQERQKGFVCACVPVCGDDTRNTCFAAVVTSNSPDSESG